MNENDKNRQMIIFIFCIIAVVGMIPLGLPVEFAFGAISSIITYTAGRYTPYDPNTGGQK